MSNPLSIVALLAVAASRPIIKPMLVTMAAVAPKLKFLIFM
jgi:hypothetical protein